MDKSQDRFAALVHAWAGDLHRYAYWLCRNRAEAEDLVQDTFLRAWRALGDLRDATAAKSWLFTILRREFLRGLPHKPTHDAEPVDIPTHEPDGIACWQTRRALHALPLEYREPLLLQVLGGYRCEEIATMLEITPAAVMTRLFRARQKLREALDDGVEAGAMRETLCGLS